MVMHLSSRLTWHDSCWNGCICESPSRNVYCTIHDHIRQSKDAQLEDKYAGEPLNELQFIPACGRDPAAYSPIGFTIIHHDPLNWRKLPSVEEDIPPYSWCTSGYRRMFSSNEETTWENDPKIQLERLKEFWDPETIKPNQSLVFFYLNHANPMKDEPGTRILVGVGRITNIAPQMYFGKKNKNDPDNPVWSRCVSQDPDQMVRIPYQEYINEGLSTENILCEIPDIAKSSFKYVAEHVSNDVAVGVLENAIKSIKVVINDGKITGNWSQALRWLNQVLDECWKERGRYPGIGNVLRHLGYDDGIYFHMTVLSPLLRDGVDLWEFTEDLLNNPSNCKGESYYDGILTASRMWQQLGHTRQKLLMTLSQFELTLAQLERAVNTTFRKEADIIRNLSEAASDEHLIDNPYILCERDRGGWDDEINDVSLPISFEAIDHGLFPEGEAAKIKGIIKTIPPNDRKRVRALFTHLLKSRADNGDTVVSLDELIKETTDYIPNSRQCLPDIELIKGNLSFYQESLRINVEEEPYYIALDWLAEAEEKTEEIIKRLLQKRLPSSGLDWKGLIRSIPETIAKDADPEMVERALNGQAEALETAFQSRFSIIRGKAGTGKTTVLEALLRGIEKERKGNVLLLAPTGKARIRLIDKTNREAQTIHQFLYETKWLRHSNFSLKLNGGEKEHYSTIIIDEASMVTIDHFYCVLKALYENDIRRLVLVGDPNQLPPIGPGKPFVDIIHWLEDKENVEKHGRRTSNLHERVRHRLLNSEALQLADAFLGDSTSAGDDEILSKISSSQIDGTSDLEVHFWEDHDDLNEILIKRMEEILDLQPRENSKCYLSFNKSFGLGSDNPDPEKWQILTPVRGNLHGTLELNRQIQNAYRGGLLAYTPKGKPKPFGDQQIVYQDKVIHIVNQLMPFWDGLEERKEYVANGEIGYLAASKRLTSKKGKKFDIAYVKYPSKHIDGVIKYFRSEANKYLELAYAITVHKAQGSDFETVFFIIPKESQILSRELMYTALTRFKDKMIVLVEKDDMPFLKCRNPKSSETIQRSTRLFGLKLHLIDDKPFMNQFLIHRTSKNVLVRSKSEVIIANTLTNLGIDYKYEEKLIPNEENPNDYRLPDFTLTMAGDQYYWEHLGLLTIPSYKRDWERKRNWYEQNGFTVVGHGARDKKEPSDISTNLVITSRDGDDGSIDSIEIEKLATKYLLGEEI
jgi:exodeoxyribonuclease V alpha subunit